METSDIVKQGIVLVPEGRQLFPYLSVMANLKLGASLRKDKEGIAKDLEEFFNIFRAAQKIESKGQYLERRGTGDAGHRPGFDGQPQASYDG